MAGSVLPLPDPVSIPNAHHLMLQITAAGIVGTDPEQKPAGTSSVVEFRLAVQTGREETTWISCSIWGKRGETAMAYITKGSRITVAGKAKLRGYTANDGTPKQSLEMELSDFTLPLRAAADQPAAQHRAPAPAPRQWQEETIPF